jgi:hypothetical protein
MSRGTEPEILTKRLIFLWACAAALAAAPLRAQQETPGAEKCPRGAVSEIPGSLRSLQDDAAGTTFLRHQSSPAGAGNEAFFLYIGKKACDVWLRLRVQFPGPKPSGGGRIRIKADDKSYEFDARRLTQSDEGGAKGYWYDELVEPDHLLMLFKVAGSARATVRLESGARLHEHVVTDNEKQALTIVLGAYHSLGGKLSQGNTSCLACGPAPEKSSSSMTEAA